MVKKKKTLIIICIVAVFIISFVLFFSNKRNGLMLDWNILLPNPDNIKIIYNYEFREGEDLEIWLYNSSKAIEIKHNKHFKKMEKEVVENKLSEYYSILDSNEKKMFDNSINLTSILNSENYYALLTRQVEVNDYLLLILDAKSNKLYYFNNNS